MDLPKFRHFTLISSSLNNIVRQFNHPSFIDEKTGLKRLNNFPQIPQNKFLISDGNPDYLAPKKMNLALASVSQWLHRLPAG